MNQLVSQSSPYLLQHKDNPVHWVPWSEEAFKKAEIENKLVLVSIGYSACHWCHVMEHECFEDPDVAAIMNELFVCIKVDREERPDVDKAYMEAVQMMNKQGGWPLNCFTLPNKKPFFGGTYFPKKNWISILTQIGKLWEEKPEEVLDFSNKVSDGVANALEFYSQENDIISLEELGESLSVWKNRFDNELGGMKGAPKFPLPSSYQFLLNYALTVKDAQVLDQVHLTLTEMCRGGIYDQIGGGFSRYSVDDYWKVPHFEKMLYDNAQLLELYGKGASVFTELEFQEIVTQTIQFLDSNLLAPNGLYYSALDADSEGVEGKYYVWNRNELLDVLTPEEFEKAAYYYNFNAFGEWEGNYIPLRQLSDDFVAKEWGVTAEDIKIWKSNLQAKLLKIRTQRIMPGLDNKILCSWNSLLVKGLIGCKHDILKTMALMNKNLECFYSMDEGKVYRTPKDANAISGFLDDYVHLCDAVVQCYVYTSNEKYIKIAKELMDLILDQFYDKNNGLFLFTPINANELFTPQTDFVDDVIPSSNAIACKVLNILGKVYGNAYYQKIHEDLLRKISGKIKSAPMNYSYWMQNILTYHTQREIVIVGQNAEMFKKELNSELLPTDLVLVSTKK